MTNKDPRTDFKQIVERLAYPITAEDILDAVRTHGSTNSTVEIAEQLPKTTYGSAMEVMESIQDNNS